MIIIKEYLCVFMILSFTDNSIKMSHAGMIFALQESRQLSLWCFCLGQFFFCLNTSYSYHRKKGHKNKLLKQIKKTLWVQLTVQDPKWNNGKILAVFKSLVEALVSSWKLLETCRKEFLDFLSRILRDWLSQVSFHIFISHPIS